MSEQTDVQSKLSRRRFGVLALGGAGALVAGGVTVFTVIDSDDGEAVRSFDVHHDTSVYVTMTNGAEFVVEVKDTSTREVLERHERVTARNLLSLKSDYVEITELV